MTRRTLTLAVFLTLIGCTSMEARRTATVESPSPFLDDENNAQCTSYSDAVSPDQQTVINRLMAKHAHRVYHFLWHATRNSWSDLTAKEKKTVQTLSPLWGRNTPLCPPPAGAIPDQNDGTAQDPNDFKTSPAGEEFLLMHHNMLATLQAALAEEGLPCIASWKIPPPADDAIFPMPEGEKDDDSKTDVMGTRLASWAQKLHDPAFLAKKPLSYIGMLVEWTIHNEMHMRWATLPQKGDDYSPDLTKSGLLNEDPKFDAPEHNWLGNPYNAHVNPIFWKLHGWVDDTIALWLRANGKTSIAFTCADRKTCYEWKSDWVGPEMHDNPVPKTGSPDGNSKAGKGRTLPDPGLGAVLSKIARKAGFRNRNFHENQSDPDADPNSPKHPRTGAPRGEAKDALADPEAFFRQYGPCASVAK